MGIPGIYQAISPSRRVALVKLAIEKYEETGRPFRVAIDTSIWSFQVQAAQGGTNPALRTLYYRLQRLLSVSVQPLFVFDGLNKPTMKRNKHSGRGSVSIPDMIFKQLLKYFGFPYHTAPGEAEAECALFQREGIVDAVLSEDVDTLMFGCGLTLRNWTSESTKGRVPTHVDVYDAENTKARSKLDREGMILVALLSGGDYDTNGVTGFGINVACQAAKAGFGKSLCRIARTDSAGYAKWRETLDYEIRTNESKFFKSKHKGLKLPGEFPKLDILGYYTHPVVSTAGGVTKFRDALTWDTEIDIVGLRQFVAEAFEWRYKIGACKFIRGLAPVLLVNKLRRRGDRRASGFNDAVLTAMNEMELVRSICGKRINFATDALSEMRLVFLPNDIVGLDLDAEEDFAGSYGRDALAPQQEDDQVEAYVSDDAPTRSSSPSKKVAPAYDPTQPDKVWVSESFVRIGIPLKAEDYEETMTNPKKLNKQKALERQTLTNKVLTRKTTTRSGMPAGAMDKYVKVTKNISAETTSSSSIQNPTKTFFTSSQPALPSSVPAPCLAKLSASQPVISASRANRTGLAVSSIRPIPKSSLAEPSSTSSNTTKPASTQVRKEPWSFSKPASKASSTLPISKPNLHHNINPHSSRYDPIILSSSPLNTLPTPSKKHSHSSTSSSFSLESDTREEPEQCALPDNHPSPPRNFNNTNQALHGSDNSPMLSTEQSDKPSPRPPKKRSPGIFTSASQTLASSPNTSTYSRRSHESATPPSTQEERQPLPTISPLLPSSHSHNHVSEEEEHPQPPSPSPSPSYLKTRRRPFQNAEPSHPHTKEQKEKYVTLRASLPGAWKETSRELLVEGKTRAWRSNEVEVVDLTGEGV